MQLFVQPDYYVHKLQSNHELAGESMLCMSGHARSVPEARVHPAVQLLPRQHPCVAMVTVYIKPQGAGISKGETR